MDEDEDEDDDEDDGSTSSSSHESAGFGIVRPERTKKQWDDSDGPPKTPDISCVRGSLLRQDSSVAFGRLFRHSTYWCNGTCVRVWGLSNTMDHQWNMEIDSADSSVKLIPDGNFPTVQCPGCICRCTKRAPAVCRRSWVDSTGNGLKFTERR